MATNIALEQIDEENDKSLPIGTMPSPPRREARERELLAAYGQLGDANEVLNERAVAVMKRMSDKLTGRDFLQEVGRPINIRSVLKFIPELSGVQTGLCWHTHEY